MDIVLSGYKVSSAIKLQALESIAEGSRTDDGVDFIRRLRLVNVAKQLLLDEESSVRIGACEVLGALTVSTMGLTLLIMSDENLHSSAMVRRTIPHHHHHQPPLSLTSEKKDDMRCGAPIR